MKKTITTVLIALALLPVKTLAQGVNMPNDTATTSLSSKNINYIIEDDNKSYLKVGHFTFKIGIKNKKEYQAKRIYDNNLPSIYFTHAQLNSRGFAKSDALKQAGSSYEWGMYLCAHDINLSKNGNTGMSVGLGFSRTSFRFKNDNVLMEDEMGDLIFSKLPTNPNINKSWLRYWSIRMPVTIGYRSKNIAISAGPELEWRIMCRSRAKYEGSKHTIISEPDINPLAVNAIVNVSIGDICILGRVGLTDLLKIKSSTVKQGSNFSVTPFSVGIGF
ncbi:MAG: hypothetical protein K6E54_07870 [Bacteroidaceae bacterium]|nr:hypothetical protein [Bacteroidaceae bacterium]